MAPEQLEGREVDHRANQFAFGIVLSELLTGRHPYGGETGHEIAAAILRDTPRPVTGAQPNLPAALARILTRCLARPVSQRYASTADLALALADARTDSSAAAVVFHKRPARTSLVWAAGALLTITVGRSRPARVAHPRPNRRRPRQPHRPAAVRRRSQSSRSCPSTRSATARRIWPTV